MSDLEDDDFYGEDDDFDMVEVDAIENKKQLDKKRRLLRERIELQEIARSLDISKEDWDEAFPDL